jgi:hypothetical protein
VGSEAIPSDTNTTVVEAVPKSSSFLALFLTFLDQLLSASINSRDLGVALPGSITL